MRTAPTLGLLLLLFAAPSWADGEARGIETLLADLKSKDRLVRLQAAKDAAAVQDSKLVRPLSLRLKDEDAEVRAAAIEALARRSASADQKKAVSALLARVPRKGGATDPDERAAILDALHDLARRESVKPLADAITLDTDLDEVRGRLTAIANVPHADAVETLIKFLDKGRRAESRGQRNVAVQALRYATGVKLNRDADKWRAWWREAKQNFNFEAAKQARADANDEAQKKRDKQADKRRKKQGDKKKKQKKDGADA